MWDLSLPWHRDQGEETMAFSVCSERQRRSGVNEIAQVSTAGGLELRSFRMIVQHSDHQAAALQSYCYLYIPGIYIFQHSDHQATSLQHYCYLYIPVIYIFQCSDYQATLLQHYCYLYIPRFSQQCELSCCIS